MEQIKRSPLHLKHTQAEAHLVDFFGWLLPLEYTSILKETRHVRLSCGLFDVSHMGEIRIKGRGAGDFLQNLTSNDLSLIRQGQLQYNLFINSQGGIIDDCLIYNRGEEFLCVVNASNTSKVLNWLKDNKKPAVEIIDESDETALLSLQGPCSPSVIEKISQSGSELTYMHFIPERIEGREVLISRSGYTGEDGFEIYASVKDACWFWDMLLSIRDCSLQLCGLGARDILRIEAGYPLYGQEITETITPFQASLDWAVKLNKYFIGREALLKKRAEGIKRRRAGFILTERAFARKGYPIYFKQRLIGEVTSGAYSPNRERFIGMAFLEQEFLREETPLEIKVRDKLYPAKIAVLPFVEIKTKRKKLPERQYP